MSGPKIAVIGAGSYFFGKQIIHKMASSSIMDGGTLALVDTDKACLATMMKLAKRVFKGVKCNVKVVGNTDRKKVLKGCDFVVLTYSWRNAHYRKVDTEIAAKHGMRMCSSDTIGPGGVFRAMRELPHALEMAKDVRRLCPDAWLINFVNPTTVMGMGLRRYAPDIKSFALCDGHHEPYNTLMHCKAVGILPEDATVVPPEVMNKLELKIGGVNHCTWLTKFTYGGKDMMPKVRANLVKKVKEEAKNPNEKAKPRYSEHYSLQLYDIYGAVATAISHTKEYVPFFQGTGVAKNFPEPLRTFDADIRQREMDADWGKTEDYAAGKISVKKFMQEIRNDHAGDIIESMWGGLGKPFYINTANRGAISNMPYDAFVELRCDVDMNGPRPQPFGEIPRGVLAIQHQILDTHELTAEAAVTGDRAILRRALMTDPICNNIADGDACIADLLAAEKDVLPSYWYKKKRS